MKPEEVFSEPAPLELARAILEGPEERIRRAIPAAGLDARGRWGVTPLLFALLNQRLEALRQLLAAGAGPNLRSERGDSAVTLSAGLADVRYLESVLRHGGDPSARNARGETPLIVAAVNGREECVAALLSAGSPVDERDDGGWTALMWAVSGEREAIARRLLAAGADRRRADGTGLDAVSIARQCGDDAVRSLIGL